MNSNSRDALLRRRDARTMTWRGPALFLFARTAFGIGAEAVARCVTI